MKQEIRPMEGGESKTFSDSEFHAKDSELIVTGTWIPDRLTCIPDVKAQVSSLQKQKIPRFRNPAGFVFSYMGRWDELAFSDTAALSRENNGIPSLLPLLYLYS